MKTKIILVLVILAMAGFWAYERRAKDSEPGGPLVLYGNVDIRELTLGFRVSGRIENMFLEEGDRGEAGEAVAALDNKPYADDLAVKTAQVRQAEAALENAEKKFQRQQALLQNQSVSQSDYDDTLSARDELAAQLDTAKATLELTSTSFADTRLTSPSSGTVITRACEPGTIVAVGQTVYVVSLDSPVWVRAYVEEPDLGRLRPGQKVGVRTDSGGSYTGQIGFISPRAEFTPKSVETLSLRTSLVYRLRIAVDSPDQALRQGMPVTIVFDEARDR